jgi:hypothetical protein
MYSSDAFRFFAHFWWLIFPIAWLIGHGFNIWLHHRRAQHTLELIKLYADQGREPPPQLLEALRAPLPDRRDERWDWSKLPKRNWIPVGLFFGLAAGFVFAISAEEPGLFFGFIMAGLGLGFVGNILQQGKDQHDQRNPPP